MASRVTPATLCDSRRWEEMVDRFGQKKSSAAVARPTNRKDNQANRARRARAS